MQSHATRMEKLHVSRDESLFDRGDNCVFLSQKPQKCVVRGKCLLTPIGLPLLERGGGESVASPRKNDVVQLKTAAGAESFACEVFLKQFYRGKHRALSKDFESLSPPFVPEEYIQVSTEYGGRTEKVIGRGAFGVVLEGLLIFPRGQMKKIVLKELHKGETLESIKEEAKICLYLESTGYVPLCYGLTENNQGVQRIIQECFGRGLTLFRALNGGLISSANHVYWVDITYQLVEGLSRIHAMDVLINDIKADNILLDFASGRPTIKYCDFGLVSYKVGIIYSKVNRLLSPHIGPEHAGNTIIPTSKANDVFGLGRLLRNIYNKTNITQLEPIIKQTTHYDPSKRCTAAEALQDLAKVFYHDEENNEDAKTSGSDKRFDEDSLATAEQQGRQVVSLPLEAQPFKTLAAPTWFKLNMSKSLEHPVTTKTSADLSHITSKLNPVSSCPTSSGISSCSDSSGQSPHITVSQSGSADSFTESSVASSKSSPEISVSRAQGRAGHVSESFPSHHYTVIPPPHLNVVLGDTESPCDPGGAVTIVPVHTLEDIIFGGPNNSEEISATGSSVSVSIAVVKTSVPTPKESLKDKIVRTLPRALLYGIIPCVATALWLYL